MPVLDVIDVDWKVKGGIDGWLDHTAATLAVFTCVRWKRPFLEEACVWDTTDLDNRR